MCLKNNYYMCFFKLFFIFLTFYILQAGPINVSGPGNLPPTLISTGLGALIYALVNALKKLTHCVNALKN